MRNIFIFFIASIILYGCSHSKKNNVISDNKVADSITESIVPKSADSPESFLDYIKKIEKIDIPVTYTCQDNLKHIDDLESKFIPDGAAIMGLVNSIDKCHFIIYSYPADIRLPILEVYSNKGEKVKEVTLLDIESCPFDDENLISRFDILNDTTIRLENISIQETDTTIVDSRTISLSELID